MSEKTTPEFIGTRHSIKPGCGEKSAEGFFGLSEKGVELARARARELLERLQQAEDGTVFAFMGATEMERTKATIRVYEDEIRRIVTEDNIHDIDVFGESEYDHTQSIGDNVRNITAELASRADRKAFISFPLQMNEFKLKDRWQNPDQSWASEYAQKIFAENDYDNARVVEAWLQNQGHLDGLEGPNPQVVAEEQFAGIDRIKDFVGKLLPDRPVVVGFVGHTPNLEALNVYLQNGGRVDVEGFEKTGRKIFGETDIIES